MTSAESTSAPIVVEQTYAAPAAAVWTAITDQDSIVRWFFKEIRDFEPRVGAGGRFVVVLEPGEYPHEWEVTEVVPGRRIASRWRYPGLPGRSGDSLVTWELSEAEDGTGTRLTLTHSGIETFSSDDPVFTREAGVAGWTYFLCESLKEHLEPAAGGG